jgi:hypothetical protein
LIEAMAQVGDVRSASSRHSVQRDGRSIGALSPAMGQAGSN